MDSPLTKEQIETCLHFVEREDARGVFLPKYLALGLCQAALRSLPTLQAQKQEALQDHQGGASSDASGPEATIPAGACQWIAAADSLPEPGTEVLVCHVLGSRAASPRGYDVAMRIRDPAKWVFPWDRNGQNPPPQWVTHWQHLPPPPDLDTPWVGP